MATRCYSSVVFCDKILDYMYIHVTLLTDSPSGELSFTPTTSCKDLYFLMDTGHYLNVAVCV